MKQIFALALLCLLAAPAMAQTRTRGYFRSNGTYVQSYTRSNPNSTVRDNYSYKGNINPYNGRTGTDRYYSSPSSQYYNGSTSNNSSRSGWAQY